jgi:hypothetical protein
VRLRIASILTAGALMVGAAFAIAGPASAGRSPQASSHKVTRPAGIHGPNVVNGYCKYVTNTVSDSLSSQNFEASFDAFDDWGAADCKVGKRKKVIHKLAALGVYYNGYGPAVSENVVTWGNSGGLPGTSVNSQTLTCTDVSGSFSCDVVDFSLKGKKWFTVQANMDFSAGGQWGWSATADNLGPFADQWINPGGGFGLGTSYVPLTTLDGISNSFLYQIS